MIHTFPNVDVTTTSRYVSFSNAEYSDINAGALSMGIGPTHISSPNVPATIFAYFSEVPVSLP